MVRDVGIAGWELGAGALDKGEGAAEPAVLVEVGAVDERAAASADAGDGDIAGAGTLVGVELAGVAGAGATVRATGVVAAACAGSADAVGVAGDIGDDASDGGGDEAGVLGVAGAAGVRAIGAADVGAAVTGTDARDAEGPPVVEADGVPSGGLTPSMPTAPGFPEATCAAEAVCQAAGATVRAAASSVSPGEGMPTGIRAMTCERWEAGAWRESDAAPRPRAAIARIADSVCTAIGKARRRQRINGRTGSPSTWPDGSPRLGASSARWSAPARGRKRVANRNAGADAPSRGPAPCLDAPTVCRARGSGG